MHPLRNLFIGSQMKIQQYTQWETLSSPNTWEVVEKYFHGEEDLGIITLGLLTAILNAVKTTLLGMQLHK